MKKSCGKKLWRACAGILLALAVWITATPYAVAAETNGDADSQAQEIRQIQDNIVSWKAGTEGEKQLLAGELLDGAGSPGSDWYAFTIARMGEEKENQADGEEETVIDIDAKPEITFDDFGKMQFQVGEIISCEAVPKSKKLLCSQVKIGSQVKQIVSGIRKHYTPEEMVGKKVMVLVNLKSAKLAGVLSEGMLLCAEDAEGNLALMTPEKAMPAGAEIC